ncbi:oxygen-insensitive NADPH nitroreductase [Alkalihalobacillus trypoxylicola]|uniref:NADPH-dependent oxidoreductase n=1 Tax=Alkalihalobacillus trypoxylicola TaxID=519424 RepID=A0A162E5K0_9BACI|nr:oxygen-insensitive NADPH nitroreductase [Alkalihalobacillus trypoxylicola]KYG31790.1 NADPH-dependent oxidoreductase [Alkalihalobacillus trypoxylicola]
MSGRLFNEVIQNHRSIRQYTDQQVSDEIIKDLLQSAKSASTSHNVQAYSIIIVRDVQKKKKLAELTGNQSYVEKCPVFFVLCADYYRLKKVSEWHNQPFEVNELEQVLVGGVDTALVAQNLLLAAEAYGLGGVMIGGIRNQPKEVAELLNLPKYTFPVMGLCIGYPAQSPELKPRLPESATIFYDEYNEDQLEQAIKEYDQVTEAYYGARTNSQKGEPWSKQMAQHLSKPNRAHLESFIKNQGFLKS